MSIQICKTKCLAYEFSVGNIKHFCIRYDCSCVRAKCKKKDKK